MEKIKKLKRLLNKNNLDGYYVPKNDEFFCEYISANKDRLKFISNFSGSYGFAIILKDKNYLFVDGRYTLQANIESKKFFKVITLPNKLPLDILKKKKLKIGYDPRLHTKKNLNTVFNKTRCKLIPTKSNLIDKLWFRNEKTKSKEYYLLPKKAVGQPHKFKIKKLISSLNSKGVNFQLITSSENIAWLLNIRGNDSEFTPLPNALLTVDTYDKINLFCDLKKINQSLITKFKNIKILDIKQIEFYLSKVRNKKILLDADSCSLHFDSILNKNNKIIYSSDPINFLKSIKSKIEINNIIKCHIYDGAALTKFLFWLKKNYKVKNITEIKAQETLLKFRKKNKSFKSLSFPTISGSGPNGSIIHYKASKKSNRKLKNGDIYLVDSGGQYNYGTTDVTRTISLDNNKSRIKDIFTRVLKGHIAVANYNLKNNTFGAQIDLVARKPLKEINLDYAHGTGHGVGYFLNVHEGPQAISKFNKIVLKEGMVISNEPGYYENGKFGIRIENLLRIKKVNKKISFENLTIVPIDKTLINKNILSKKEIDWLNNYHRDVFHKLKKYMNRSELISLKTACSKI